MGQLIGAASDAGILNPERSKAPLPTNPILGSQRHNLSYITPIEAQLLRGYGGGVTPDGGQSHFRGIPSFQPGPGAPSAAAAAAAAAAAGPAPGGAGHGQGLSPGQVPGIAGSTSSVTGYSPYGNVHGTVPGTKGFASLFTPNVETPAVVPSLFTKDMQAQINPETMTSLFSDPTGLLSGSVGEPDEAFTGSMHDKMRSALDNDYSNITMHGLPDSTFGHVMAERSPGDEVNVGVTESGLGQVVGLMASALAPRPIGAVIGALGDISGNPNPLSFSGFGDIADQVGETFTGSEVGEQEDELPVVVAARGGEMPKQAQQLANQGRYGDTMLVHMNPREMAGIASLAPNRSISTNPQTGLPEMFDFMDVLPTIAGIGASFFLGPLGAAAVSGLTTAMTTKDIGKGVMAGLMSYGLGSLMGAGSESATQAATAAGAVDPAAAGTVATDIAKLGSGGAYPAFAPGQAGAYGQAVQGGGVILPSPSAATGAITPSAMQSGMLAGGPSAGAYGAVYPQASGNVANLSGADYGGVIGPGYSPEVYTEITGAPWGGPASRTMKGMEGAMQPIAATAPPLEAQSKLIPFGSQSGDPRALGEVFPNDARLQQLQADIGAPFSSPPPKADGILGGIGEDISNTAEMLTDRTYWDLADTPGYVDDDAARALGFRSVRDLAIPLGAAGMGAAGTIGPLLEEEYEDPTLDKRTYASTRQISPSEFRTATAPPPGYDPAVEGEWSYYGNKGGIVNNLPMIYAKRGYGGEQVSDVLSQVVSQQSPTASPSRMKPTPAQLPQPAQQPRQQAMKSPPNTQAHLRSFMPSAYAKEGAEGRLVKNIGDKELGEFVAHEDLIRALDPDTRQYLISNEQLGEAGYFPGRVRTDVRAIKQSDEYNRRQQEAKEAGRDSKRTPLRRSYFEGSKEKLENLERAFFKDARPSPHAMGWAMLQGPIDEELAEINEKTSPIFKQDGGPAGSPVRPEEIMGAEEVATVGIMAGAPDVVQEGVREEASIMNPTNPQNAEERAIYDKAVLALEGELEPSDAQNAVDEYIEVFGAEAYRSLKNVVNRTRETSGIVKPANGETTVPNGEFQGEDIIAGKIVNKATGEERANLFLGEDEYVKTGKDLAYAAAARGLPPTPENGAMVEGMEEEALRRAFG